MTIHKIYALTSIGRPVEWKVPTNRAMLILMAPSALAGAGVAFWQQASAGQSAVFGLATAFAAFGGWAMGRELDPDDQPAAFIALVVSVLVMLFMGHEASNHHLLVLFTTLGLVRQVNRTTGLEARISDSILLLALSLWVIYGTANPLFGLVAGLSFALDAGLERPLRRQIVFALLSFGAIVVYMVDHDVGAEVYEVPHTLPQWWAALAAVVFALNILLMREVNSVADVNRRRLDPARVRGGMVVSVVAVAQGLPSVEDVSLLASVIAGLCIAWAFRRSFRTPA